MLAFESSQEKSSRRIFHSDFDFDGGRTIDFKSSKQPVNPFYLTTGYTTSKSVQGLVQVFHNGTLSLFLSLYDFFGALPI
jgi:hypothetical protein